VAYSLEVQLIMNPIAWAVFGIPIKNAAYSGGVLSYREPVQGSNDTGPRLMPLGESPVPLKNMLAFNTCT